MANKTPKPKPPASRTLTRSRPPLSVAHPWHGVSAGAEAPELITCYIEIVSTDVVKYELDKETGILRVDRPQKYSNVPPSLYGFVPRSYCAEAVAQRCMLRTGKKGVKGDGDPIDVCVLTERPIAHSNILVQAVPIGGFRMVDKNEADDKIIAVLKDDPVYAAIQDVANVPPAMVTRLKHYFLTYKLSPEGGVTKPVVEIAETYGRDEALEVLRRSFADYAAHFG
jgi:inorganic pyrophosphatase